MFPFRFRRPLLMLPPHPPAKRREDFHGELEEASVAALYSPRRHRPHGHHAQHHGEVEATSDLAPDAGDLGDTSSNEPQYGAGSVGISPSQAEATDAAIASDLDPYGLFPALGVGNVGDINQRMYGAGDIGTMTGIDPMAMSTFGQDPAAAATGALTDTSAMTEDLPDDLSLAPKWDPLSMGAVVDTMYDPDVKEGRIGTLRNYGPDFGLDDMGLEDAFYSGFGLAGIVG